MSQMKEQNKSPEKELNKMGPSNLSDAEFKTLVIRMLNELRERVDELRENLISIKKGMETIKKKQSDMKNTLTEKKKFTGNQQNR